VSFKSDLCWADGELNGPRERDPPAHAVAWRAGRCCYLFWVQGASLPPPGRSAWLLATTMWPFGISTHAGVGLYRHDPGGLLKVSPCRRVAPAEAQVSGLKQAVGIALVGLFDTC